MKLCIGVLAKNEAHRIEACLASARFADQLIVVDGASTDNTVALAQKLGAEVYLYPDWQGFAEQRNRLLKHVRADYIFFLDADEIITDDLRQEIQSAVASQKDGVWQVQWLQVAFGEQLKWMKSTGGVKRMFKAANIERFEGVVHEGAVLKSAQTDYVFKHKLLHSSRENVYDSLKKLAQYVQLGSAKRRSKNINGGILRGAASGFGNFIRLYIFGRGFMCGGAGFLYCFFIALECFFRYAALKYDLPAENTFAER